MELNTRQFTLVLDAQTKVLKRLFPPRSYSICLELSSSIRSLCHENDPEKHQTRSALSLKSIIFPLTLVVLASPLHALHFHLLFLL
ncbi:unnamed protein product [Linum tenue]|uniref:Uncharacterized protein n=1 Tax=Linum tenue TaxID=586396 RepID=A0AAV0MHU7_9ROSI|nr:unnamed protein product [Linum tenue]